MYLRVVPSTKSEFRVMTTPNWWLYNSNLALQCFFSTYRTELVVYLQEKLPNSTIKRVPASTLYQNMKSVSQQLQAKQVIQCVPKASMSEVQLQNYLKTPPAGL